MYVATNRMRLSSTPAISLQGTFASAGTPYNLFPIRASEANSARPLTLLTASLEPLFTRGPLILNAEQNQGDHTGSPSVCQPAAPLDY